MKSPEHPVLFGLSEKTMFTGLLAAGLTFYVLVCWLSGQWKTHEYWEYGQIASQIQAGKGYQFPFTDAELHFQPHDTYPSALMPPGYVLWLVPFLDVAPPTRNFILFGLQIGLSVLAMALFFGYVKKKAGPLPAVLTLSLQITSPDLLYVPSSVGPGSWFQFLVVLLLLASVRKISPWPGLGLGILAGCLVLFRSEALAIAGLLAAGLAAKKNWSTLAAGAGGLLLVLLPWLIRNQQVFGRPLLSQNAGVNFYRGHNPGEIGDWPPVWDAEYLRLRQDRDSFEKRYDQRCMQLALDWIQENPGEELRRIPVKLFRFWAWDQTDPRSRHPVYLLLWLPVFGLGLVGLRRAWGLGFRLEIGLFLLYSALILVFFPQIRYLSLIKFFWMVPAGLGALILVEAWKKRKSASF